MSPTVVSLCDLSGKFTEPWLDAGYHVVLVDPQHGVSRIEGRVTKIAKTIDEAMPFLSDLFRDFRIAFVAGWPPCTQLAGSGARWWEAKRAEDVLATGLASVAAVFLLLVESAWQTSGPGVPPQPNYEVTCTHRCPCTSDDVCEHDCPCTSDEEEL